jgi:hypothetical protein
LWRRPRPKLGCGTKERRRRILTFLMEDMKTKDLELNGSKHSSNLSALNLLNFNITNIAAALTSELETTLASFNTEC